MNDNDNDKGQPNVVIDAISNAIQNLRADDDMLAVLNAYSELHPKAIEKVDAASARANPTIADAVEALLKKQGKNTDLSVLVPGVSCVDRTIETSAGLMPARIFTPEGSGPFPVVVYFHGGRWVIADKGVYDGGRTWHCQAGTGDRGVGRLSPRTRTPLSGSVGRCTGSVSLGARKRCVDQRYSLEGRPRR